MWGFLGEGKQFESAGSTFIVRWSKKCFHRKSGQPLLTTLSGKSIAGALDITRAVVNY
ncbi:MAG: hypothetical protein GX878_11035 [Firmicutes bacterium]|nr:hypothetical protein [Bacillota bacterium]